MVAAIFDPAGVGEERLREPGTCHSISSSWSIGGGDANEGVRGREGVLGADFFHGAVFDHNADFLTFAHALNPDLHVVFIRHRLQQREVVFIEK